MKQALWAIFFLSYQASAALQEEAVPYGASEQQEARDLAGFIRKASALDSPVPMLRETVRITHTLRIYVGQKELKIRPMAKAVLLLFLRHPEGIVLKRIGDYRSELLSDYRRVMRSDEPADAEDRVQRLLDIFSNELNVNISRVNTAFSALVSAAAQPLYRVRGKAGHAKTIPLDRTLVLWE